MSDFPPEGLPEWSDEELALWKSARDDRPPGRSLAATLQAVGIGSAITTAASGAGAGVVAKAGIGLTLFKWGAVVGLASAVAVGGGLISRHSSGPAETAHAAVTTKTEAAPRKIEQPPPKLAPVADEAPRAQPARNPHRRRSRSRGCATAAHASSSAGSQPDIAQEIKNIDTARALLRQGRSKEALSALDQGKSKSLGVEATVLRIEALFQKGDHARARALANSFLAAHPKSPYASRIRALMRNSSGATDSSTQR